MRKLYFLFCLSLFAFTVQAQFLMKSNTHLLRTGDEHYFIIANNANPGLEGADIIWDFSNLEERSNLTSYMYSAYTTEKSAEIPEANAVLEEFGNKFYFKVTDGIIEQYGTVTKNNTITKYDEPFVKMVFPFNYGDQYSGNYSGVVEGKNNYQAVFSGTYTLEADAFGTLKLPGNIVYNDVVRIKTEKQQCYNNQNCNCSVISYKWYSQNVRYPLLTIIQNKTSQGVKPTRTAYYAKAENDLSENKNESFISENIKALVYPNPFKDEFKIDYTIQKDADVLIAIYDNSGKRVSSISRLNQKAGNYSETINTNKVGEQLGMYHIRIIAGCESISKTIVRTE